MLNGVMTMRNSDGSVGGSGPVSWQGKGAQKRWLTREGNRKSHLRGTFVQEREMPWVRWTESLTDRSRGQRVAASASSRLQT